MKWTLIKEVDLLHPEIPSKRKLKILPVFSFKILKGLFSKIVSVGWVLIGFYRSIVGDVDHDARAWFANSVNFLKKLNEIGDVLKEVAAKHLVDSVVQEWKLPFGVAHKINVLGQLAVNAQIAVSLDAP